MSDRLIDRWVSGMASAEDRAELCELIEKDPALADRLFRAAERECDLAEFFRGLPTISTTAPTPTRPTRLRRVSSHIRWLPIASGMAAALMVTMLAMHFAGQRTNEPTAIVVSKPAPTAPPVVNTPVSTPVETLPIPLAVDERTTLAQVFDETVIEPAESTSTKPRPTAPENSTTSTTSKPTPPVMLAANTKPKDHAQHIDRVDGELKDADGNLVMRYSLRAPQAASASEAENKKSSADLGLLLCFHGAGGNEQWLADPMLKALRSQGDV